MSDDIRRLAVALADTSRDDEAWGDARARLYKALEAGLRDFIRANPPGAGYQADAPMGAYWLYHDAVLEHVRGDDVAYRVIDEVFNFSINTWEKTAKAAIAALKRKGASGEKDRVVEMFPEYPELLREIREAKSQWAAADKEVKKTHAFRMMGGLARMGLPEATRYRRLVERAQEMEKKAVGKVLTQPTRVKG